MKTFLLSLLFVLISPILEASEQGQPLLYLDHASFAIEEFPLERHTEYQKILNKIWAVAYDLCPPRLVGYRSIYAINEGKLWLWHVKVNSCSDKPKILRPKDILNEKTYLDNDDWLTGAIQADWYTGTLTFRISEYIILNKDSDGRVPGYEYEAVVYHIKNGEVASRSVETIRVIHDYAK